jgi:hypothetical protein
MISFSTKIFLWLSIALYSAACILATYIDVNDESKYYNGLDFKYFSYNYL